MFTKRRISKTQYILNKINDPRYSHKVYLVMFAFIIYAKPSFRYFLADKLTSFINKNFNPLTHRLYWAIKFNESGDLLVREMNL